MEKSHLTPWPDFRFTPEEVAGAVGDYGTLIPVPVEPMKAVGAIVIAEGLSKNEIAASGMIL